MVKEQYLSQFVPDVILEVTTACDRNCPGCYSPTLVSKESPEDLLRDHPSLFMTPEVLSTSLAALQRTDLTIAMRGGEPSRHFQLGELIIAAQNYTQLIYIETHGRWILNDNTLTQRWLEIFKTYDVICKLSFDSMHGLKSEQLKLITEKLDTHNVYWMIAITEVTENEFALVKASCPWIPESKILFQKKVKNHNELIQPPLGIISTAGVNQGAPSSKETFKPKNDLFI